MAQLGKVRVPLFAEAELEAGPLVDGEQPGTVELPLRVRSFEIVTEAGDVIATVEL